MWLIEKKALEKLQKFYDSDIKLSDEQLTAFGEIESSDSRIMTVDGEVANINVTGVLTNKPDFIAWLFGGGNTTYSEINSALAAAEKSKKISSVQMNIDSPGGSVSGLFDTIENMQSFSKPINSVVINQAASAAYGLASQSDSITASNKSSTVGSIGVAVDMHVSNDVISITSTKAPKKRPDAKTDEGVEVIREELDAIHDLFVEAIASGRGIKQEEVNKSFGQGGSFLADEALKRGMIDVVNKPLTVVKPKENTANGGVKPEKKAMDIETLRTQHKAVFDAVFEEGVQFERDRAEGHLTMGAASGDMKTALDAVADGSMMTVKLQAKYMSAGMNRADIENRQSDDPGDTKTPELSEEDKDKKASDDILAGAKEILGLEA
jgi:ClpP class serine protease